MLPHAWVEGFGQKVSGLNEAQLAELENGNLLGAYFDKAGLLHYLMIAVKKTFLRAATVEVLPMTAGKPDPKPIGFHVEKDASAKGAKWIISTRQFSTEWPNSLKLIFLPQPDQGRSPFLLMPKTGKPEDYGNRIDIQGPYYDEHPDIPAPLKEDFLHPEEEVIAKDSDPSADGWVHSKYEHDGEKFQVKRQRITLPDGSVFIPMVHAHETDAETMIKTFDGWLKSLKPHAEPRFFSLQCEFCSVDRHLVDKLITGPGSIGICNHCVELFQIYFAEGTYDVAEFDGYQCGYCGKLPKEVPNFAISLVYDHKVGICAECVKLSAAVIAEEREKNPTPP